MQANEFAHFRHWSFDLWNTLIRPNPAFKRARSAWIFDRFAPSGHSSKTIEHAFSEMNRLANSINEKAGKNLDSLEILAFSLHQIGVNLHELDADDLQIADHVIRQIFFENPPLLFDDDTILSLDFLKKKGCSLSLLSNTGSIRGETLKIALAPTGLFERFDFLLFSDEIGVSKPNLRAFDFLKNEVKKRRPDLSEAEILHVGDSPKADDDGAKNAGLAAALINSNNRRLSDLLT